MVNLKLRFVEALLRVFKNTGQRTTSEGIEECQKVVRPMKERSHWQWHKEVIRHTKGIKCFK